MGWRDAPIVSGEAATNPKPSWMDAPIVAQSKTANEPARETVATTDDGGIIYRLEGGALGFTSPSYATTDPAQVARIMEGATPAEVSTSSFDQMTIADAPIASRFVKAAEGVPFLGSRIDEAAGAMFGENAMQGVRAVSGAMDRERPNESTALNIGGAIAGSVPLALSAGPSVIASASRSMGANALRLAGIGAAVGGVEGAVYGSGEGEGSQERLQNATQGATLGTIAGGVLGAAAPFASEGIARALARLKGSDVKLISSTLGISASAARVVKNALDAGNMNEAAATLAKAGDNAMLADAGQPARQLLDAAAATGGAAGRIATDAVEQRVTGASKELTAAMDQTLGAPKGIKAIQKDIRQTTAEPRAAAYDAAYSKPINYAGTRGRMLETLLRRVPDSAIRDANELMKINGEESGQIMARIGDDGAVSYEVMPDVRQIDYITRALQGVADKADGQGKLGGQTPLGVGYSSLSRNIRSVLKGEVPEYAKALDVAADAISRRNASDLGYSLMRDGTRREDIASALNGASKAERAAMQEGVRSYIDDMTANVKRVLTDGNQDAREALKVLREMSSRANETKIRMLVGRKKSKKLFEEIEKATVAFELRAALAQNSKTAIRSSIQNSVDGQTAGGALEYLAEGKPLEAGKRFIQVFTGSSEDAKALRASGIYEEIATALTATRGGRAKSALSLVNKAMAGQRLTELQAAFIGSVLASGGVLAGSRTASQQLSTR